MLLWVGAERAHVQGSLLVHEGRPILPTLRLWVLVGNVFTKAQWGEIKWAFIATKATSKVRQGGYGGKVRFKQSTPHYPSSVIICKY